MKSQLHTTIVFLLLAFGFLFQGTIFAQPYLTLGSSTNIYLGYSSPCKSYLPIIQNGEQYNFYTQEEYNQLSYEWTLDRPLISGESMDITTVGVGFLWPVSPPVLHYYGTVSEATLCLLDTAQLCLTVTDWNGNTGSACTWIYVEDVRCSTGNGDTDKVVVCHYTGSGYEDKCVSKSAVPAHLGHGDHLGACTESQEYKKGSVALDHTRELQAVQVFPNPVNDLLQVSVPGISAGEVSIQVISMSDRVTNVVERQDVSGDLVEQIDVSHYASGTYLVKIISGSAVAVRKVVVVH